MVFPDANVSSPKLSPSLEEFDPAILTDENANALEIVALVPISATGTSGVASGILTPGVVSQVTDRRQSAMVNCPGGEKIKVMGVVGLDSLGNPIPFAPGGGAAATAVKVTGKFQSAPETGTGSVQSIPHGLGVVPTLVLVAAYDNTASGSTPFTFQIVEGAHTSTNVLVTATSGLIYKVIAFA